MTNEPKPKPRFTPTGKPTSKRRPDLTGNLPRGAKVDFPDPETGLLGKAFDETRQAKFFFELGRTGQRLAACRLVGIHPRSIANRMADEEFAERYEEALQVHRDQIEDEIYRRAIVGVDEPVFFKGEATDVKRVYSDQLLLEYARAHIPKYRPRSEQLNVNANLDLGRAADIKQLSPDQRERLRALLDTTTQQQSSESPRSLSCTPAEIATPLDSPSSPPDQEAP